jgi:hypothetical protein
MDVAPRSGEFNAELPEGAYRTTYHPPCEQGVSLDLAEGGEHVTFRVAGQGDEAGTDPGTTSSWGFQFKVAIPKAGIDIGFGFGTTKSQGPVVPNNTFLDTKPEPIGSLIDAFNIYSSGSSHASSYTANTYTTNSYTSNPVSLPGGAVLRRALRWEEEPAPQPPKQ